MAVPKLRQSTRQAEKCQKEQEKLQTELDAMESQPTESKLAEEPAKQKGKGKGKGTIFVKWLKQTLVHFVVVQITLRILYIPGKRTAGKDVDIQPKVKLTQLDDILEEKGQYIWSDSL